MPFEGAARPLREDGYRREDGYKTRGRLQDAAIQETSCCEGCDRFPLTWPCIT